jgi:predicted DNA-binding mobile mystery protein A
MLLTIGCYKHHNFKNTYLINFDFMSKARTFNMLLAEQLDESLQAFRSASPAQRPSQGWARAVRQALGMSAAQLARRVGVSRPTIATLETSEARGTITLASLEKLARGLGCRLVYALVPEDGGSLEDVRRKRALEIARKQLARVSHTMKLEAQGLSAERERRLLAGSPRRLWE